MFEVVTEASADDHYRIRTIFRTCRPRKSLGCLPRGGHRFRSFSAVERAPSRIQPQTRPLRRIVGPGLFYSRKGWNAAQSGGMSYRLRKIRMDRGRWILAVAAGCLVGAAWAGERCSAIDGGTLQCGRDRVRVEGLRAPGLQEPGGQEARQRLQRRIQSGEVVIQRQGRDRYGRTLGRLYVNGDRITQLDVSPRSGRSNRRP